MTERKPTTIVIFGASGDLTKRLPVPALYNLACDGLLSPNCAVLGTGRSDISDEGFRESMASDETGLRALNAHLEDYLSKVLEAPKARAAAR